MISDNMSDKILTSESSKYNKILKNIENSLSITEITTNYSENNKNSSENNKNNSEKNNNSSETSNNSKMRKCF